MPKPTSLSERERDRLAALAGISRGVEGGFRSRFENSTEGIFQTTPEGEYLMANSRLAQIYGYPTPEALVQAVRKIGQQLYVQPGRREEFVRLLQEDHEVVAFESQVYRRDGKVIWPRRSTDSCCQCHRADECPR